MFLRPKTGFIGDKPIFTLTHIQLNPKPEKHGHKPEKTNINPKIEIWVKLPLKFFGFRVQLSG